MKLDRDFYDTLPPSTGELISCPPVPEQEGQRLVVDAVIAEAREAGLTIPQTVAIHWRVGGDHIPYGTTEQRRDGSIRVHLDALRLRFPHELRSCLLHELMHVSDIATGISSRLDRGEREYRADRFRYAMLAGDPIPDDLLPPSAPTPAIADDRATSTPTSRPSSRDARAARVGHLHRELQRRLVTLSRGLPDGLGLRLRAILPAIAELADLARRDAK